MRKLRNFTSLTLDTFQLTLWTLPCYCGSGLQVKSKWSVTITNPKCPEELPDRDNVWRLHADCTQFWVNTHWWMKLAVMFVRFHDKVSSWAYGNGGKWTANGCYCFEKTKYKKRPVAHLRRKHRWFDRKRHMSLNFLSCMKPYFKCMGKIFRVVFQRYPLKCHMKYHSIHWKTCISLTAEHLRALSLRVS